MSDQGSKPQRHKPSPEQGKQALRDHIIQKAMNARLRYGLYIDSETILRMLDDREVVRFPTGVRFDAEPLQAGEFAFAFQLGEHPRDGFCIFIHPHFENQPDILPLLIAYHLVVINYGTLATAEDAELFGATLLGLDVDSYYQALCELADSLVPDDDTND